MRLFGKILTVVNLVVGGASLLAQSATNHASVFTKELDSNRTLAVWSERVRFRGPTTQEKEIAAKLKTPESRTIFPEYVYESHFDVIDRDGKRREVWSHTDWESPSAPLLGKIKVLNVALVDDSQIVIVTKLVDAIVVATIVDIDGRSIAASQLLSNDGESLGTYTSAATIDGSIKSGTLQLTLQKDQEAAAHYKLVTSDDQYKWIQEKDRRVKKGATSEKIPATIR